MLAFIFLSFLWYDHYYLWNIYPFFFFTFFCLIFQIFPSHLQLSLSSHLDGSFTFLFALLRIFPIFKWFYLDSTTLLSSGIERKGRSIVPDVICVSIKFISLDLFRNHSIVICSFIYFQIYFVWEMVSEMSPYSHIFLLFSSVWILLPLIVNK